MEKFIQILVVIPFIAGAICLIGCGVFWTAASFSRTPEVDRRSRCNSLNGPIDPNNLTEHGRKYRTWAIRCLVWSITLSVSAMIVGGILLAIFVDLKPAGH